MTEHINVTGMDNDNIVFVNGFQELLRLGVVLSKNNNEKMKDKPKECCNSKCNKIIYVPAYNLHLPLICKECQTKNEKK